MKAHYASLILKPVFFVLVSEHRKNYAKSSRKFYLDVNFFKYSSRRGTKLGVFLVGG